VPDTTTIFTWGYHGWGNATPQLVQAVDAVEAHRGFAPPLFVDIRIRRGVRARGFIGPTFEKLLGSGRYRWMRSLGNQWIESRTGPAIQIANPSEAATLLELALDGVEHRRRVLFFCSCPFPCESGQTACHRETVAGLVLEVAATRGKAVELVEWPGGERQEMELEVTDKVLGALRRGRATIPLGESPSLALVAGLPWGSIVTVRSAGRSLRLVSGPAVCQSGGWVLPVFGAATEPTKNLDAVAVKLRQERGLNPRRPVTST
jgi:hypothetical protein